MNSNCTNYVPAWLEILCVKSHSNLVELVTMFVPILQMKKLKHREVSSLPQVTQLTSGKAGM